MLTAAAGRRLIAERLHPRLLIAGRYRTAGKMTGVEELVADLRSLSTSRVATPLASDTEPIMPSPEAQAAPVESAPSQQTEEEEQKRKTAAEKWYNPNGPPVGSHMGARLLEGDKDVWDHNAW